MGDKYVNQKSRLEDRSQAAHDKTGRVSAKQESFTRQATTVPEVNQNIRKSLAVKLRSMIA